ncbi:protein L-Myc [Pleurodeles waltl]
MELDALQHYFYFYDTDLEEDTSRSVAPSEDIWKKFELVPSPRHLSGRSSGDAGGMAPLGADLGWDLSPPMKGTGRWTGAMSSMVLLRDCMWGDCLSTRGCLEKVFNERLSGGTPKALPAPKPEPVAPVPVTKNPEPAALPSTPPPDTKPPISSGSDTPSDSDDDDEIDVVTVQKRRARQARQARQPVMITVRADLLDPCMKHFHISIHQQQHNYAARMPQEPPSQQLPDSAAPVKVEQEEPPLSPTETLSSSLLSPPDTPETPSPLSPKGSSSGCGSSGSDGEVVKKKNHNFMERKRRYDLRSRFLALRDEVPGLATTSKTPKVVILGEATAFLHSLVVRERRLALEKRQLQARQRQLRKLILRLKAK